MNVSGTNVQIPRLVKWWLFAGIVLIFVQVIIGGITRLTDSGLSITEWEVIKGTLPPLNEIAWETAFEKYKTEAKKQYEALHADMSMSEFKLIYFWEWFHRFWARSIGLVFLFPFIFFLYKKWLPKWLIVRLGIVVLFAALAAVFGIIMVYSGFNDDTRTWVSAYKLLGHLSIACLTFGYLFWTWLKAVYPDRSTHIIDVGLKRWMTWLVIVLLLQIGFGALMAGMRAGLVHPYFPITVNGGQFYSFLFLEEGSIVDKALNYERSVSVKAWVQLLHRLTAYILSVLVLIFCYKSRRFPNCSYLQQGTTGMFFMLLVQFVLGIMTVINCFGKVPLVYGTLHQAGALILLAFVLFSTYHLGKWKTN